MNQQRYWSAFAICQTLGCVLPQYANVHSNPFPLFAGIVLTLPGGLMLGFIPNAENMPDWEQYALLVLINFVVWFALGAIVRNGTKKARVSN